MKANKIMKAFRTVQRVLYYNAQILGVSTGSAALGVRRWGCFVEPVWQVTCTVCGFLVLVTATMLYYVQDNSSADFESIPATTYLAVSALTLYHFSTQCLRSMPIRC